MAIISTHMQDLEAVTEAAETDELVLANGGSNAVKKSTLANLGARLLNAFSWSALATTAKTIVGAINELNTNLTNATYGVGDTFTTTANIWLTGVVTSGGKEVYFTLPFRYVVSSKVTGVTISNARFVIRQGNAYCYGSSASTAIGASTNTLTLTQFGLDWKSTFENNTNVTNNSPIGVMISSGLKVTFR